VTRALAVDDISLFRAGLTTALEAAGYSAAEAAEDAESAVAPAEITQPDIKLLDVPMPGISGIDAPAEIATVAPDTAVVPLPRSEHVPVSPFRIDLVVHNDERSGSRQALTTWERQKRGDIDSVKRKKATLSRPSAHSASHAMPRPHPMLSTVCFSGLGVHGPQCHESHDTQRALGRAATALWGSAVLPPPRCIGGLLTASSRVRRIALFRAWDWRT
jgi:hypothetical protein